MSDLIVIIAICSALLVLVTAWFGYTWLQRLAKRRKNRQPFSIEELKLVAARLKTYTGVNIALERVPIEAEPAPHQVDAALATE